MKDLLFTVVFFLSSWVQAAEIVLMEIDWRQEEAPVMSSNPPGELELNLVLGGQGTVCIGPSKLVEYPEGTSMDDVLGGGAWWSDQTGGWIGGLTGGCLGCLEGLLKWLAGKGVAQGFVLASLVVTIVLGCLLSIAGVVALAMEQPYGVWFVLLLPGLLMLTILPARYRQFRGQYESLELRRMASLDTP
ncbi:MAG TPA: hypothetical protein P5186_16420 [Candidatus Paceibacterota bacterium]|nr:hypothetical protein [Verrucomicrobiota bacterium]HRY49634.1 hypothetical protein [Candidatus Paceibacterota bacterium]